MRSDRKYQSGFGNHFASEALPQALPVGQNSPQRPPYGLIAELLSGSAFTVKRSENQRSWLYRIRPSVVGGDFIPMPRGLIQTGAPRDAITPAAQLRWNPLPMPQEAKDFVQSLVTFAANGDADAHSGSAVHLYACNRSMETSYFQNADGDLLIVPQSGGLELRTEFGIIDVKPGEIAVIQRGIKFQVRLHEANARGYICENYGQHFELPNLGPIGSSGLANPRDFETPEAAYEDVSGKFRLQLKFGGELFEAAIEHSPLDVVAWHGNYAPYKYDLSRFNTINTVSYDHPDPSIFTVLTAPTDHEGRANVDFVIFPPRWMVAQHTFRPPYFHRNIMSEYMGLIYGVYDAKPAGGFEPGGGSLHNCMLAHGPETQAFEDATQSKLEPHYIDKTMAFMFESSMLYRPTRFALEGGFLQKDYRACWQGLKPTFDPKRR